MVGLSRSYSFKLFKDSSTWSILEYLVPCNLLFLIDLYSLKHLGEYWNASVISEMYMKNLK